MSSGSFLSLGLGTFSDVNHVVTLGYTPGIGLADVVPAPADVVTIPLPPRPPTDFVMNGGFMAGFKIPKFDKRNMPAAKVSAPRPREESELREMMNLFSMWKKAA